MAKEKKIEREHIVPLVKAYDKPKTKRAAKAVNILKAFMKKHFHIDEKNVLVSNAVNELIWGRGIEKPPRKIKIKAVLEEGKIRVLLPNEKLPEKKEEKKKERAKTKEEIEKEKEEEKKKQEKKEMEKEADTMAIKRGAK